jgi:hypothetical protein
MNKEKEVQKWLDRMAVAMSNQEDSFKKFSEWYDDMYAVVKSKQIAPWRSKIYFPRLTAKLWQIIPKMVMGPSGFRVTPIGEQPDMEKAKKAEALLDYQYENPQFDEPMFKKLTDVLIDAMVTGKGIAQVCWEAKREKRRERIPNEDGTIVLGQYKEIDFLNAYPEFKPVNIFNFFYSPGGKTLQSKHWLILKDFKTIQELESDDKYQNINELKEHFSGGDKYSQYNYSRNRLVTQQDPISADSTVNLIEVWYCYEKATNEVSVVAPDAGVILQKKKNPYWHEKYPFVDFEIKPRAHDFWGEGIFEVTKKLQAAINSLFNHYFDSMNLSLDGFMIVPETTTIHDYQIRPGGIIRYSGPKPEQGKLPEPNPSQLQVADEILSRAMDEVTILPYAAGITASATDKTKGTKGGILALQAAADDILGFMRQNFVLSKRRVGMMWLQMDQQYLDRNIVTDKTDDEGQPISISPAEIQGQFNLKVDDESEKPVDPEMEKSSFYAMIDRIIGLQKAGNEQAMAIQGGQPLEIKLNFQQIIKEAVEKEGKSAESYLLPEELMPTNLMGQMPGMQGMPEMPGMPPQMPMPEMPMEQTQQPEGLIGRMSEGIRNITRR